MPLSIDKIFITLLVLLILGSCSQQQQEETEPIRRKSPIAIAKALHQPSNTYVKIVYGQPYKRGRDIFGQLVPYEEVWRTGANEATELTTTKDISFGGGELKAGTYALFTIPKEEDQWTIILNSGLGQWGAFEYHPENDVLRVEAPAIEKETSTEPFTIRFTDVIDDSTSLVMQWDQTEVSIPIRFLGSAE